MSIDRPSSKIGDATGEKLRASPRATATTGTSGARTGGAKIIGGHANNGGPGPQLMAADTLAGDPVVNRQGETLGEIQDIMIDVPSGSVGYAVLSFGGVLGNTGDKLFAIPWNALILDADNRQFILDVPKGRLETAPGFDKDHCPMIADQRVMHRPENTTRINRAMVLRDQAKLLTITKQPSRRHMGHV